MMERPVNSVGNLSYRGRESNLKTIFKNDTAANESAINSGHVVSNIRGSDQNES